MTVPAGWIEVPLSEIAELSLGKMLDRAKRVKGQPRSYLRNINVRWGSVDLSDLLEMPFEEDEVERYSLCKGDVLVCEGGEPGRAAVWEEDGSGVMFQKALHRVRPSRALLPRWLVLHLKHQAASGELEPLFSGTTIKHFTGVALSRYRVRLPPLDEQRRILAESSRLLERAALVRASLSGITGLLDRLRQSILAAAFRGDLTADWREAHPDIEPADELLRRIRAERRRRWEEAELEKMRRKGRAPLDDRWKTRYEEPEPVDDSQLPELPDGWAWARAADFCSFITNGDTPPPDRMTLGSGDVPFIKVYNLTKVGKLDFTVNPTFIDRATHENDLKRSRVIPGDVLLNIVGPPLGKVALVSADYPEWNTNQAVVIFRAGEGILGAYLLLCLLTESVIDRLVRTAKATAGQFNIALTACRRLVLPVAPLEEQREIVSKVTSAMRSMQGVRDTLSAAEAELDRLDRSILSKAFRGELVPQDPSDEPAAALLERIRAERNGSGGARQGRGRRTRNEQSLLPFSSK